MNGAIPVQGCKRHTLGDVSYTFGAGYAELSDALAGRSDGSPPEAMLDGLLARLIPKEWLQDSADSTLKISPAV